jgi:hypothetical protein
MDKQQDKLLMIALDIYAHPAVEAGEKCNEERKR